MDHLSFAKALLGGLIGYILWALGGWDALLELLFLVILLDVALGIVRAFLLGKLSFRALRNGLFRKVGYFVLVSLAVVFDRLAFHDVPAARTVVACYLIATDALSVLEHLGGLGVPFPESLRRVLERMRENYDQALEEKVDTSEHSG